MPDERERRENSEEPGETLTLGDEVRAEPGVESIGLEAEVRLAAVEARAASFVARAQGEGAVGQAAAEKMRKVGKEAQELRRNVWQRLDEIIGVTEEGRNRKWESRLAIPDNPKVYKRLKEKLKIIERYERALDEKQGTNKTTATRPELDDGIIDAIAGVADDFRKFSGERADFQALYKKIGGRVLQAVEALLKKGKQEKALELWGKVTDCKEQYVSTYFSELVFERIANTILANISQSAPLIWKDFEATSRRDGLERDQIKKNWETAWFDYMAQKLNKYPDLLAVYEFSRWNGNSYTQPVRSNPDLHLAMLEKLLQNNERDFFLSYFFFPKNWRECLGETLRDKAFARGLENNLTFLVNNFEVFEDKFRDLSQEDRKVLLQKIFKYIGRDSERAHQFGHGNYSSGDQNATTGYRLLSLLRLQPRETRFCEEAMLPPENYYKYKSLPKERREHERAADQLARYNTFLESLAQYHPAALYLNGDILLGLNEASSPETPSDEALEKLVGWLVDHDKQTIIFNLYAHMRADNEGMAHVWPFNTDQVKRLTTYVLAQKEKGAPLIERAYTILNNFIVSAADAKFTEKVVDFYLTYGTSQILNELVNGAEYWLAQFSPGQESRFIEALIARGNERLFEKLSVALQKLPPERKNQPVTEAVIFYLKKSGVYDAYTIQKYTDLRTKFDHQTADAYIDNLNEKARQLVGPEAPTVLRDEPDYMYMVRYVFPSGNYSTHEKNLACGDRLEHLAGFHFRREGYNAELTGLLGYDLLVTVDGEGNEFVQLDDTELLADYQRRMGKIKDFVGSRGPDNRLLQQAFEVKIDAYFESFAEPEFKMLEGLNTKEKMLVLFVGEAIKRVKNREYRPNTDILDTVVEYKYAYHEDLGAYVNRSAQDVAKYKDATSQRALLWQELSTIYGENVKHVLRHNIFDDLAAKGTHYEEIVAVFGRLIGSEKEEPAITDKQMERIRNTFDNDQISIEDTVVVDKRTGQEKNKPGKLSVLLKQIKDIFGSNIKFQNDEDKENFNKELEEIFTDLRLDFTMKNFKRLTNRFFELRDRYRFGINARLEELFTLDLNAINREFAKFEERVEEEGKETRVGGPKEKVVKKSAKKRRITSYITKTKETANARMGAYLCIAGDQEMWNNKNYFESVDIDAETGECRGVTMFLKIEASNGKKYLWFGPNPFESTLTVVSAEQYLEHDFTVAVDLAEQNGFDGIVVPPEDGQILGGCTNRGGNFPDLIKTKRMRTRKGDLKIVEFGKVHHLGGNYGYDKGALIWQKKAA